MGYAPGNIRFETVVERLTWHLSGTHLSPRTGPFWEVSRLCTTAPRTLSKEHS
jgi:hypothetical protein